MVQRRRVMCGRAWAVAVVAAAGWLGRPAAARADADFSLGVGYAHLSLENSQSFQERDGFRIEPRFSFGLTDEHPQLRLGVALGLSGYSHQLDEDRIITINDGNDIFIIRANQWEAVSFLEPEVQLSWRQPIGTNDVHDHRGWYAEPGLGVGAVVGNYVVADDSWWSSGHDSQWDATWGVRPFVRVGYQMERFLFGGEVSYLVGGRIELTDQVHGDVRELFVGGFFGVRW